MPVKMTKRCCKCKLTMGYEVVEEPSVWQLRMYKEGKLISDGYCRVCKEEEMERIRSMQKVN